MTTISILKLFSRIKKGVFYIKTLDRLRQCQVFNFRTYTEFETSCPVKHTFPFLNKIFNSEQH